MIATGTAHAHGSVRHLGYRTSTFFMVPLEETFCGHCQKWVKTGGGIAWLVFHITHAEGRCSSARDTIPDGEP